MIVVDVGCHPWPPEESVHRLIDRFHPEILFGFDPHPAVVEGVECVEETVVVRRRAVAWTHTGNLPVRVDGITTGVTRYADVTAADTTTASVDLPAFLAALPTGVVLKIDAEGAEYELLPQLRRLNIDLRLALVLVEWHPPETAHGLWTEDRPEIRCPVEEW